jgi:hypothetical protein
MVLISGFKVANCQFRRYALVRVVCPRGRFRQQRDNVRLSNVDIVVDICTGEEDQDLEQQDKNVLGSSVVKRKRGTTVRPRKKSVEVIGRPHFQSKLLRVPEFPSTTNNTSCSTPLCPR